MAELEKMAGWDALPKEDQDVLRDYQAFRKARKKLRDRMAEAKQQKTGEPRSLYWYEGEIAGLRYALRVLDEVLK